MMRALILNSGKGTRMGDLTKKSPKCLTVLADGDTILGRQLKLLQVCGIQKVVMTTGAFEDAIKEYCAQLDLKMDICFVQNQEYDTTNYIYSIYCAREYLEDDILLMHGDLVFEPSVLYDIVQSEKSCMAVDSLMELPEKDFKAVLQGEEIRQIGIDCFNHAIAAQPLYKINQKDWEIWLAEITNFCKKGSVTCYAENAFNEVSGTCCIGAFDLKGRLCKEIDNADDMKVVNELLKEYGEHTVYMCFATDVIHNAHLELIKRASFFGKVMIGVLSDEAVCSYKRFPILDYHERKAMFEALKDVTWVVEQTDLSYHDNLENYRPDFVIHGDDWRIGNQKAVRDEVIEILGQYGGKLIEFPYAKESKYRMLEARVREQLSLPDSRRARLKKTLSMKKGAIAIEAHSGITGLIAEKTMVFQDGKAYQFDAMWISSLCDSTAKGKPDIELVDMTSRFRTIDDIMEVTTKPIIFDGDTGGLTEHFVYTVKTLERMGVSMIIIEDKVGLKKNSLFGTEVKQEQDTIDNFCEKIKAGKKAQKTDDFMICARIESLILEAGIEDALKRAFAYVAAGADAIMIHSRKKDGGEIFEFLEKFRRTDRNTPIVVVPTSFHEITEEELIAKGANIIIYANQLTRSGFPAMKKAAELILANHRAKECDDICMSIKEIITLIPEDY